ncbi:MAG: hypothetical protein Q4A11_06545 [Brachymonas sp.]|nr:hypothetical protein [Brachymonas sp.]
MRQRWVARDFATDAALRLAQNGAWVAVAKLRDTGASGSSARLLRSFSRLLQRLYKQKQGCLFIKKRGMPFWKNSCEAVLIHTWIRAVKLRKGRK